MDPLRAGRGNAGSTEAIVRLIFESDVREVLPAIRVPTLVIQRARCPGFVGHGRYLGRAHHQRKVCRVAGHGQPDLGRRSGRGRGRDPGLRHRRPAGARPATGARRGAVHGYRRVDSARRQARRRPLGTLLADHNRVVRRELDRFGGQEIRIVGDGFLATFDGPARAVRCAIGIRDGVRALSLDMRAGIHTVRSSSCRTTSPDWQSI